MMAVTREQCYGWTDDGTKEKRKEKSREEVVFYILPLGQFDNMHDSLGYKSVTDHQLFG